MGKSAAQRKRRHQLRTTGKDVTKLRGEATFSMHVRKTKTKQARLQQLEKKYKKHFQGSRPDGNAFSIYLEIIGPIS